jgi:hypothetical protein
MPRHMQHQTGNRDEADTDDSDSVLITSAHKVDPPGFLMVGQSTITQSNIFAGQPGYRPLPDSTIPLPALPSRVDLITEIVSTSNLDQIYKEYVEGKKEFMTRAHKSCHGFVSPSSLQKYIPVEQHLNDELLDFMLSLLMVSELPTK